jgi:predicted RNase H-like HicB family nuclease
LSLQASSRIIGERFRDELQSRHQRIEEGFSVSCPGLPGCWSQGDTEAEALANIQDAIREYLVAIDDLIEGQVVREVNVTV